MDNDKEVIYNNPNEDICDKILHNIINYLSNEVYVEKDANLYVIKSYNNKTIDKELCIKLNRSEFHFTLGNSNKPFNFSQLTNNNKNKEHIYETGNFDIKINCTIFNKYEKWILDKTEEYLHNKIKSLETSLYRNFNIDKKIKRKSINNIINKKEEL